MSVAGDDGESLSDEEDERTPENRPARKTWYQTALTKVSNGVKQWAAGEGMSGHVPYSSGHMTFSQRRGQEKREDREKSVGGRSSAPHLPPSTPLPPVPDASTSTPTVPIPTIYKPRTTARVHQASSPISFFPMQDELVRAPSECFEQEIGKPPLPSRRMGRGLAPQRVVTQMNLAEHFVATAQQQQQQRGGLQEDSQELYGHPALRDRGRRAQRAERKFKAQQTAIAEVDVQ